MNPINTYKPFKGISLCFWILGSLIFDVVLSKVQLDPAPVTVKNGKNSVATQHICDTINQYYKLLKEENFFKTLGAINPSVTLQYNFKFNSEENGKECLSSSIARFIKYFPTATATDIFDLFKEKVKRIEEDSNTLQSAIAVTARDLNHFISKFKFEKDKFVFKTNREKGLSLDDIAENLIVYLDGGLSALETAIKGVAGSVIVDSTEIKAFTDSEINKLNAEAIMQTVENAGVNASVTINVPSSAGCTDVIFDSIRAKQYLDDAILSYDTTRSHANFDINLTNEDTKRKSKEIFLNAVKSKLLTPDVSTAIQVPLKEVLALLNSYKIKTECQFASKINPARIISDKPLRLESASLDSAAVASVAYSIVGNTTTASSTNVSFTQIEVKRNDIGNDKIYVPHFIDTKNTFAKSLFLAIAENHPGADAKSCFNTILSKLTSDALTTAADNIVKKCVFDKSVTEEEFNEAFKSFTMKESIDVQLKDIASISDLVVVDGDKCTFSLSWLSNVNDETDRFFNYIYWLKNTGYLKLPAEVVDKAEAIKMFFTVLKSKLSEYSTNLELEAKNKNDGIEFGDKAEHAVIADSVKKPEKTLSQTASSSPTSTSKFSSEQSLSETNEDRMPTYIVVLLLVGLFILISAFCVGAYYVWRIVTRHKKHKVKNHIHVSNKEAINAT